MSCCEQKDDLARMYRLFQRIPKGLDPVAELFRKHVESEGMQRVKEATETAAAKKEKDAGTLSARQIAALAAAHIGACRTVSLCSLRMLIILLVDYPRKACFQDQYCCTGVLVLGFCYK